MYAFGYQFQPLRAMIYGIHTGHNSQQCLRSTNIRGGLIPADVLLAGLQRHAQSIIAGTVDSNANYTAGDRPFVFFFGGKKRGMRAAKAHRYAKTLAAANNNIGSPLTRRGK